MQSKRVIALLAVAAVLGFALGWFANRGRFAMPADARFVASWRSAVYHRPDCHHVRRIEAWKRVWYRSTTEAERDGRRPCMDCDPQRDRPAPVGDAGR